MRWKQWLTCAGLLWLLTLASAQAARLTQAQCTTLSTDILVTNVGEFAALIAGGSASGIATAYAQQATPTFWVWRTLLTPAQYRSAIVWTEVDTLTAGDARIFEWLTGQLTLGINAADANVRQGIADVFGAGTTTRTNLLAIARREALRGERLFATGTGSTGSPGLLVVEGPLSVDDVALAMQQRCSELP